MVQDDCKVVRFGPSASGMGGLQGWNCGFPLSRERRVGADSTMWKDFAIVLVNGIIPYHRDRGHSDRQAGTAGRRGAGESAHQGGLHQGRYETERRGGGPGGATVEHLPVGGWSPSATAVVGLLRVSADYILGLSNVPTPVGHLSVAADRDTPGGQVSSRRRPGRWLLSRVLGVPCSKDGSNQAKHWWSFSGLEPHKLRQGTVRSLILKLRWYVNDQGSFCLP